MIEDLEIAIEHLRWLITENLVTKPADVFALLDVPTPLIPKWSDAVGALALANARCEAELFYRTRLAA